MGLPYGVLTSCTQNVQRAPFAFGSPVPYMTKNEQINVQNKQMNDKGSF